MPLKRFVPAVLTITFLAIHPARADETKTFPAAQLRGFGKVSGELTRGSGGSVLTIDCESEEKAKLVLAKFLSDEQALPGVTKRGTAWHIEDQGWVEAARVGTKVVIGEAADEQALATELRGALTGKPVFDAEVKVPMWLDRWDQHGFRFYYAPWATPQGVDRDAYNFRGDSQFAKNHGVGLVFWENLSHVLGADGQSDRTFWDWDEKWAAQDGVPSAINLSSLNYDIPVWVANRYRDWMMQPMPDYLGDSMMPAGYRGTAGKTGELAWGATPACDAMLGAVQQDVRRYATHPNVVSWLEPHGELAQGGDDLMGYGPACDRTFRDYLKQHYASAGAVSIAWRGRPDAFDSWDDIKVPELADFCGWGPDALDLAGKWRIQPFTGAAAPEWLTPGFNDSAWLAVTAPGDDRNFTLPKQPAVYRRTIDVPAAWLAKHPRSWVYLWDTNLVHLDPAVAIYLNGRKIGESPVRQPSIHWMTAEATGALKPGENHLSLVLPDGYIGYRIYLSGSEPKQYPALGRGLNQEWVDLVGWRQWTRVQAVRRGMEMIREVDPNRGITLMAPGYAADGVKTLAQEYGGEFHDTGFMTGVWADLLPSLMRGSDLPYSLEPGNGAPDVISFKRFIGLWLTEGIQEVSYFIHIGDVSWHPDITREFEAELPMIHMIGKYHVPAPDLAFLWSTEDGALTGFPWSNDLNSNLPSGWDWRGPFESILSYCPRDAISESDFAHGYAAKYKMIIDTNTSIMDGAMLAQIEKYVRDGGIFVTQVQTGRHSPTQFDSWPIEKLTGYHVLTIEKYDPEGRSLHFGPNDPNPGSNTQELYPATAQPIYAERTGWMETPWITGLRMKKVASDAQDLVMWKDGTVAVGMRKLGKGAIVEFGAKANGMGSSIGIDALEPILEWAGVKRNLVDVTVPAKPDARNMGDYFFRQYDSNNGLYHIAAVWNPGAAPLKISLFYHDHPAQARDVVSGENVPLANGRLDLTLDPLQKRMLLTPRNELPQAAAEWFDLQRKWWRASKPITKPFPKPDERFVRQLDAGWAWHAMTDKQEPDAAPDFDDSKWPRTELGAWNANPGMEDVHHAELRRNFTVPAEWNHGSVRLWIATAGFPTYSDEGRIFMDGKPLGGWGVESAANGTDVGGALTPGSTHTLTVEARGKGQLTGLTGDAWIIYIPKPQAAIDLAGTWTTCKDDLFHDTGTVHFPGPYTAHSLWRMIDVPREYAGKKVMLVEDADRPFAAYVNGALVQYSNIPSAATHLELNVTPWIRFGRQNRLQLVSVYGTGSPSRFALEIYGPGTYP